MVSLKQFKLLGISILSFAAVSYNFGFIKGVGLDISTSAPTVTDFVKDWKSCILFILSFMSGVLYSYYSNSKPIKATSNSNTHLFISLLSFNSFVLFILFGSCFFFTFGTIFILMIYKNCLNYLSAKLNLDNWTRICCMLVAPMFLFGYGQGMFAKTHESKIRVELETTGEDVITIIGDWSLIKYDANRYGWLNNKSKILLNVNASNEFNGLIADFK